MSEVAVSYYVYYRVANDSAAAAHDVVATMLRMLERRTAVSGRLMQRQDEPLLWMEAYEGVRNSRAFEATLAELLKANDFAAFLAPGSSRSVERFIAARP